MNENESSKLSKSLQKILIIGGGVILVALIAAVYYVNAQKNANNQVAEPTLEPTSSLAVSTATPTVSTTATPVAKTKTYLAMGLNGNYSAVDVGTGEAKDFLPSGYAIVSQYNYPQFPSYVMLQKDRYLYSYNILSKEIKKLTIDQLKPDVGNPSNPTFSQSAVLAPSFSEKNKAYLEIRSINNPNELLGEVTEVKSYFYDFATNQISLVSDSKVPNGKSSSCFQYDSKYTRFFIWRCGEGIGNATPLTVYDYSAKTTKEIVAGDNLKVHGNINNGEFIAITYSDTGENGQLYIKSITRVKSDKDITKEVYTVSDSIKTQTADTAYSSLFIEGKNLLAMGGSKNVTLFSYNASKQLTSAKVLSEPDVYANFMFTDGDKLYYKSKDKIRVVNLDSKQVEKSFTSKAEEEVTLIALP